MISHRISNLPVIKCLFFFRQCFQNTHNCSAMDDDRRRIFLLLQKFRHNRFKSFHTAFPEMALLFARRKRQCPVAVKPSLIIRITG